MRHAKRLEGFNKQATFAVKIFKKAGLSQSLIDEFVNITKEIGGDVVSDSEATFKNGRLFALGDRGLDNLGEGLDDFTEKYVEELFAADLIEVKSQATCCEVFWPNICWWEKS